MKQEPGPDVGQVVMAANTPMLTKAAMVDGRLDAGVLPTRPGRRRDRRPADRRRAHRAHHGRGRGRRWPGWRGSLNAARHQVPAVDGLVHDGRARAAAARAPRHRDRELLLPADARGLAQPGRAGRGARGGRAVAPRAGCGRGRRTTTSRPRRTCRPTRSCRTPWSRSSSTTSRWSCSASSPPAPTPPTLRGRAWRSSSCSARSTRTTTTSTSCGSWSARMSAGEREPGREIAVLGVGMHPWGKWGRNFVEYGVVAAQAALADAGVEWRDIQFVSGADTMRNGYPGYVAGATFAQALGWQGAQVASSYAACASGVDRAQRGAGPDPRRACATSRSSSAPTPRPKGFLAPNAGERGDDPDWLRFRLLGATNPTYFGAVRPPPHGAVRRDAGRLRQGEGEERARTASRTRTRATARRSRSTTSTRVADRGRPAAAARHLRDERRRRRGRRVEPRVRASRTASPTRCGSRRSRPSRRATRTP